MANNSTSFFVNLGGNLQANAARNARSMEQMADRSAKAMGKVERAAFLATRGVMGLSNGINRVGNWAVAGMVGGTALASLASRSLIKTAAEFEMAAIRMKQNFGADGDKVFKWVTEFATKTPMQFMDVQNAALSLKTAGIDPMNGSLQSLVDFNAKLGGNTENLNGMISTISKAYLKGKLTGEELQSLQEKKVPVLDLLVEASNGKYTKAQIADAITKGKIRVNWLDALVKQMGLSSQGAAEAQMKTWDGMISNIGDNITAMQAKLMEKGIFDALKHEVGNLLSWLNEKMESGEFDEFAQKISDTLLAAIKALKEYGEDLKPILQSVGDTIGWIAEKAGGYGSLAKIMGYLYLGNKVLRGGVGAYRWAGGLFPKTTGGISGALGGVAGGVTPVYVTNLGALGGMGAGVEKATDKIAKTTAANTAATFGKRALSVVKNASVPLFTLAGLYIAGQHRATGLAIEEAKKEERAPTEEQFYRHLANQSPPSTDFWAGYPIPKVDPAQKARVEQMNAGQAIVYGALDRQLDNEVAARRLEFGTYTEEEYQQRASKKEQFVDDLVMKYHSKAGELENKTTLDGKINVKISAPQGFSVTANASVNTLGVTKSALEILTQAGYTGRQLNGGN